MTDCNSQQNCPEGIAPDNFHNMVAERAYSKAEARNFSAGHALEDWLEAEREITNQCHHWSQPAE